MTQGASLFRKEDPMAKKDKGKDKGKGKAKAKGKDKGKNKE